MIKSNRAYNRSISDSRQVQISPFDEKKMGKSIDFNMKFPINGRIQISTGLGGDHNVLTYL